MSSELVKMKMKMEEKRVVRSILMVCLVMGMLVEPTKASFKSCYESCFLICLITPNHNAFGCSFKCLKDCALPPLSDRTTHTTTSPSTTSTTKHTNNIIYYCKLGCASSLCTNFSSKHNPNSEKVESCVDSCSGTCTNN